MAERARRSRGARIALAWAPVALWSALVLGLSSEPFGADETGRWLEALLGWAFPGLDEAGRAALHGGLRKTAHVVEYALLAALVFRALRLSSPRAPGPARAVGVSLAFVAALAAMDEGRQSRLEGRSGRLSDVALDVAGGGAGLLAMGLWLRRRRAAASPPAETAR